MPHGSAKSEKKKKGTYELRLLFEGRQLREKGKTLGPSLTIVGR